jgi:hypothetical protein
MGVDLSALCIYPDQATLVDQALAYCGIYVSEHGERLRMSPDQR